jgi:hypothetical protein
MSTPSPEPTRNGHAFKESAPPSRPPSFEPPARGALPAFVGTLGALVLFALLAAGGYFTYHAIHSAATTHPVVSSSEVKNSGPHPLSDASTWALGQEPATKLEGDGTSDVGWWTRTFYLPATDKVQGYLQNEGLTVSRLEPLHYEDSPQARTITYQVDAEVPTQLLRVPRATWSPSDPDLRPFASVLVLNNGLPAGQFWNTAAPTVAEQPGAKLDFAWKVSWDKSTNSVTTDRLPYNDGVFTQPQITEFQDETNNTIAQLRTQIAAIDAKTQADVQAKLAQVPANPPRPELLSSRWGGNGSGEPTKSAERMGGGTLAGAAGGAAIGAAAGDAGLGAGIGAGAGLLGGFIYDTVSKNNDRERYQRRVAAENSERMGDWRSQVRALDQQRDQVKQEGETQKQQALQDLANQIAAANGRLDAIPAPADTPPQESPPISEASAGAATSSQPSGPLLAAADTPSDAPPANPGGPMPSGAVVIDSSPDPNSHGVGNIQITYANGQTEMVTQDGRCSYPHVSPRGDVGWVQYSGSEPKYGRLKDIICVRSPDGAIKHFETNALFVENWGFSDNGSTITIRSMHHHGPNSYIKYDLATGKTLARIDGYVPDDQLPSWAAPYNAYVPLGQ